MKPTTLTTLRRRRRACGLVWQTSFVATCLVVAACGGDNSSDDSTQLDQPAADDENPTDEMPTGDEPTINAQTVIDALNDEGDALLVPQLEFDFWGDASPLPATVNYAVFCGREAEILRTTFDALPRTIGDPDVDPAYEQLRATRLAYTDEQDRICNEITADELNMPVEVLDDFLRTLDQERDAMNLACVDALEAFSGYGVLNCSREPIAKSAPADFVLDMPPPEIMQRAGLEP